jgi:hypothetical protein
VNHKSAHRCLWTIFLLVCLFVPSASIGLLHGQSTNGAIQGTVTDPAGQAMQGANVAVVIGSGVVQRVVTGADGKFVAAGLPANTYIVEISATGFSTQIRHEVVVAAGATVSLPVALTIASVSEEVRVEAEGDTSIAAQLAPVKSVLDAGRRARRSPATMSVSTPRR